MELDDLFFEDIFVQAKLYQFKVVKRGIFSLTSMQVQ